MTKIFHHELNFSEMGTAPSNECFRRATPNMIAATLACQHVLNEKLPQVHRSQISFIVGTHFGELHSSLGFLNGPTPSPTLFQNSLHNSIMGFVSSNLGLTGPGMTISCDRHTPQACEEMAQTLSTLTSYVLVCLVDSVPEELRSLYLKEYPHTSFYLDKSICSLYASR